MSTDIQPLTTPFTDEGFQAFLDSRQEPLWLTEIRQAAWEKFQSMNWPTVREEEWMRTDIRMFKLDKYHFPGRLTGTPMLKPRLSEGIDLAGSIDICNGVSINPPTLDPELAAKGVIFGNLSDLLDQHGDLIREYLFKVVDNATDRFAALHQAAWFGGTFLYVPRNVRVEKPLHSLNTLTDGGSDFGHSLVILEEGAEATLMIETNNPAQQSGLHCGATEVFVADRANLRFVHLQDWSQKVWHFALQKAVLGQDANLQWTVGALGSRLAKVNQHVFLRGSGANCQVNGVMFTQDRQHLSYHTLQHHEAPECHSDFLYKSALQDESRTVWRGMIKVDQRAQLTDGYQRNDNLMLSRTARADSIPGLEIEADNVRCTHGSTSGRVDEELIFYAMCRGFTRKEAIRAIVIGFFQQVFDRITIESVREALGTAIAVRVRDYK
jgi:Fe-S cluster assembly protein SufD